MNKITAAEAKAMFNPYETESQLEKVYACIRRNAATGEKQQIYTDKYLIPSDVAQLQSDGYNVLDSAVNSCHLIKWDTAITEPVNVGI